MMWADSSLLGVLSCEPKPYRLSPQRMSEGIAHASMHRLTQAHMGWRSGLSRQHGHHPTEQSLIEAQVVKGGSHLHSDDVGGLFAAGRSLLRA